MKTPANPVTTEDAAKFHSFIEKWQGLLNLGDWRLLKGDKAAKGAMADMAVSLSDRCAVYRIGTHFGTESVTDFSLEQTVVHELLHIHLAEFRELVAAKCSDEILMAGEHKIIHTLEKLLVKP